MANTQCLIISTYRKTNVFDILPRLVSGMFISFYFPLETSICCRQHYMQNVGKRNACCFGKQTQMSSLIENSLHIIEFHHYLFDFSRGTNFPFPLLFLIFITFINFTSRCVTFVSFLHPQISLNSTADRSITNFISSLRSLPLLLLQFS